MNLPPLPLVGGAIVIDNSGIEKLRCPRLFQYEWLQKRSLVANKAGRNFGSTLHAGWAVRYEKCGTGEVDAQTSILIQDVMGEWLKENPQPPNDFRDFNHACRVMEAYNQHYRNEPFKILTARSGRPIIEVPFSFPLGKVQDVPVIYIGKIDLGIEDNNGLWVFDHKTAFQFGDTFDAQMSQDGGQLGYCWALKQMFGQLPNGYIIDAVRIRRPKKGDEYMGIAPCDATDLKRMPFYKTEDDIEEWVQDTLYLVSDILWHHDRGHYPRHRWQCTNKFGKCDMFEVCSLPRNQRDFALGSSLYEENTWTPLNKTDKIETEKASEV